MFNKTERDVNWPCILEIKPSEHATCSTVFYSPSPVKFAVAISFQYDRLSVLTTRMMSSFDQNSFTLTDTSSS